MVVVTKASTSYLVEPTIFKELAEHKKRKNDSKGEARLSGSSGPTSHETYLVPFQDPNFRSNLFSDAYLHLSLERKRLLDLGQLAPFHYVKCRVL